MEYSMAQAVALTDISAHTLRKWESRYSFLEAKRTETNIRFYTDDQIKKLLNISILIRHGYRISKIDKMTIDEIHNIVTELSKNDDKDIDIKSLSASMIEMNENLFEDILNENIRKFGLLDTVTELLYPFLVHIGILWGTNKIMPAQEHFISSIIRKKIFSKVDALPQPETNAKKIVLFLPEGEHHEIGLLLAYYIARNLGWRVFYLGQNVPTTNINQVIKITKPDVLLTIVVTLAKEKAVNILNKISSDFDKTILLAGNIDNNDKFELENVKLLFAPKELIEYLK
ncbi:MerR family transcriptional regulator [Psychroserpens sp. S379A]|uniref:MerR family transcriptional regulator n=1 Tax=Psychroserpens sp. S379A TaxID=3415137 RepID=UPI003C7A78A8